MNLYLTVRWRNPESPDGPDGPDTNFLVRADSVSEAAAVTDDYLVNSPTTSIHSRKPVQSFCQYIVELGVDNGGFSHAEIIHDPWIAYAQLRKRNSRSWTRLDEDWTSDVTND
jgi:hypothetical protein